MARAAHDCVLTEGGNLLTVAAAWPALGTAAEAPRREGAHGNRHHQGRHPDAAVADERAQSDEPCTLTLGPIEVRGPLRRRGGQAAAVASPDDAAGVAMLADAEDVVRSTARAGASKKCSAS